jgi:2,3-bisphosphoglycerate-dependent phosphoglycerate mutase
VTSEIILVRHASSVPPSANGPDERTRPLTAHGHRQAHHLVQTLADPPGAPAITGPGLPRGAV